MILSIISISDIINNISHIINDDINNVNSISDSINNISHIINDDINNVNSIMILSIISVILSMMISIMSIVS